MAITQQQVRRLPEEQEYFRILYSYVKVAGLSAHTTYFIHRISYFFSILAGGWPITIKVPRMYACT